MLESNKERIEIFEVPPDFRLLNSLEIYNKSQDLMDRIDADFRKRNISMPNTSKHTVLNMKKIKIYKEKIDFILNISDYPHYVYTQENHSSKNICRSMSSVALLETSDNYFILVKTSKHSLYPDLYQCISALIDINDCDSTMKKYMDPKKTIMRQLKKELNINIKNDNRSDSIECKKLIVGKNMSSIDFFYHINIEYSKEEMKNIFEKADSYEVEQIVFIKNNKKDIINFMGKENIKTAEYIKELFYRKSDDNSFLDYLKQHSS
ncbi:MAG: hypothetical protein RR561_07175 [Peptostreptococcus sp.]|uniref:hypothetical protein n=1 Tax=Peptostreptococcus sp. TaxID=1262 RepID=UPI002FC8D554